MNFISGSCVCSFHQHQVLVQIIVKLSTDCWCFHSIKLAHRQIKMFGTTEVDSLIGLVVKRECWKMFIYQRLLCMASFWFSHQFGRIRVWVGVVLGQDLTLWLRLIFYYNKDGLFYFSIQTVQEVLFVLCDHFSGVFSFLTTQGHLKCNKPAPTTKIHSLFLDIFTE